MIGNLNFLKNHLLVATLVAASSFPTMANLAAAETKTTASDEAVATKVTTNSAHISAPTLTRVEVAEANKAENILSTNVALTPESSAVTSAEATTETAAQPEAKVSEALTPASKTARDLLAQEPAAEPEPTAEPLLQEPTEPVPSDAPDPTTPGEAFEDVDPGRATRSGYSYIGIGGNIGIVDGDTDIGDGSFVILSKIGLTPYVSVRPELFIGDDVTIAVPITYDFATVAEIVPGYPIAPFVGIGPTFTFNDDFLAAIVTAGVDVPITRNLTATASTNFTFFSDFAFGILLGIGYNVGF
uniref:Porin family protein n=1 Tax=Oscillatoriales cyanobacterium SpSt-418 TaxID=2282169 RepID=A0A7C3KD37_9CYAN